MEKRNDVSDLQQRLIDSYKRMADMSLNTMRPLMDNMTENVSMMSRQMTGSGFPTLSLPSIRMGESSRCCPPEPKCPPHCIATITRHANRGERIVVPFLVHNGCSSEKTYRVGVRELKNDDGQKAPAQPSLNKQSVTLAPGQRERVEMTLDLKGFNSGTVYSTDIVLREKDYNQNICFRLFVEGHSAIQEVTPHDEKKYRLKWQDWRSHFYCEPKKTRAANIRETISKAKES